MWQLDPAEKPTMEFILSRVHPDDAAAFRHELACVRGGADRFDFEHRCVMPDGSVRHLHAMARARIDEAGELEYLGAMMDLTAAREAQRALQQAHAELAHLTRVTTMGELAASIAHEVNQPLAGVITHSEACLRWLDRKVPELGEVRAAVECVVADGRRAAGVIRKLRALARRTELRPEPQRIDEIVEDALMLVQREIGNHRIVLEVEWAGDLPQVAVDRVHLQQVVINLVLNAIQAMAGIHDRPRRLTVRTRLGEVDQVDIVVSDSGAGIDPTVSGRLFEPFCTTKDEGMGMGLAISRTIVEAHGGRIWATAHDGPGASFHISLPAAAPASATT